MITTKNGDVLRNLEEQVAENKRLIIAHYDIDRVLADVGITVVGDALQTPPDTLGLKGVKWGEAYPVGYQPPYNYYVWSRPTPNEEDITKGEWFNIGPLAIPGPRGFAGPQGLTGPRGESTKWYVGENPNQVASPAENDLFLDAVSADVYEYKDGVWVAITNIRGNRGATGATGPQGAQGIPGEQGPQGEPGLPGSAVTIRGILQSIDELRDISPAEQEPGTAYLVKDNENNYIIWVALPEDDTWEQAGPVQASVVVVGGNIVSEFNADTKVDKVSTAGEPRAYTIGANGQQTITTVDIDSTDAYSIAGRTSTGTVRVGTPVADNDATTKKYVDDAVYPKLDRRRNTDPNYPQLYQVSANSDSQSLRKLCSTWQDSETVVAGSDFQYSAAQRDQYGCIQIGQPRKGVDAVNKNYAEANYSKKLYRHTIYASCYGYDYDGNSCSIDMVLEVISTQSTDVSAGAIPEASLINLIAGTSAPVAHIVASGYCNSDTLASVSFTRADNTITAYNHYDEVIAAFQQENGVCRDLVLPIG